MLGASLNLATSSQKTLSPYQQSRAEQDDISRRAHIDWLSESGIAQISEKIAAEGGGFIINKTSFPQDNQITIDLHKSRLSRMKRAVTMSANYLQEHINTLPKRYQAWLVTLTYADGVDFNPYDITKCINSYRKWVERLGYKAYYTWVAEIQEKRKKQYGGHCVHYHIVIWLPLGVNLPKFDKRGWWSNGMSNTKRAFKPVGYLVKYASKGASKSDMPKGARIHGAGGLPLQSRWKKTWWLMPRYVREYFPCFTHRPIRRSGGGFISRLTGETIESLYEVVRLHPLTIKPKEVML